MRITFHAASISIDAVTIANNTVTGGSNVAAMGSNVAQHVEVHQHNATVHVNQTGAGRNLNPSKPSFLEIRNALDAATPYNRHSLADNYRGIPINWRCEFVSADKEDQRGKSSVIFRTVPPDDVEDKYDLVSRGYMVGSVRIDDHPYLKIAQEGHIQKVEYGSVWLNEGFHIGFD